MLFSELSIKAVDRVLKEYRDPSNPQILNPDLYKYEFTPDGELIEQPEVKDRFGKEVKVGDLVMRFTAYNNNVSIFEGQLLGFQTLKKDGSPRQKPYAIIGWPGNTPKPIDRNGEGR
jgi:hypothetical protein